MNSITITPTQPAIASHYAYYIDIDTLYMVDIDSGKIIETYDFGENLLSFTMFNDGTRGFALSTKVLVSPKNILQSSTEYHTFVLSNPFHIKDMVSTTNTEEMVEK